MCLLLQKGFDLVAKLLILSVNQQHEFSRLSPANQCSGLILKVRSFSKHEEVCCEHECGRIGG
jgi:hypothetical protein